MSRRTKKKCGRGVAPAPHTSWAMRSYAITSRSHVALPLPQSSRSSAVRCACGQAPHSLKTPNRTTTCIARCPRALETLEQPHTSTPRTSCDRVCLPCCDHSCPTPAAHTLALRWLCAGRIIQGGNHGEGNRGATTHHHSAETKRARSLTPQPRIPRGVRVEHCTGGKRSPHRPLVATLDGSFTPRRDGSALERRL